MALIQITADLNKVAKALERIADLLDEMLHPPIQQVGPSTEEDVSIYGEEVRDGRTVWDAYASSRDY